MAGAPAFDLGQVRPGFTDPPRQSQAVFREIMESVARPGRIADLSAAPAPPPGLSRAAAAVALTLWDFETPVWISPGEFSGEAQGWIRFHCGCPLTTHANAAAFALALAGESQPRLDLFNPGDARYPDRSTTLVLQVAALTGGPAIRISGPGVPGAAEIAPLGVPRRFWNEWSDNRGRFQFGVDVLLAAGDGLIGLPRTIHAAYED